MSGTTYNTRANELATASRRAGHVAGHDVQRHDEHVTAVPITVGSHMFARRVEAARQQRVQRPRAERQREEAEALRDRRDVRVGEALVSRNPRRRGRVLADTESSAARGTREERRLAARVRSA